MPVPPDTPPNPKRRGMLLAFAAAAVFYALWLMWLAYVAWINTQSGNQ